MLVFGVKTRRIHRCSAILVTLLDFMTQKLILVCFIAVSTISGRSQAEPANAVFWKELQKLCGKAFVGAVAAAPADDTTFKDIVPSVEAAGAQQSRSQIY